VCEADAVVDNFEPSRTAIVWTLSKNVNVDLTQCQVVPAEFVLDCLNAVGNRLIKWDKCVIGRWRQRYVIDSSYKIRAKRTFFLL
jgi:hypothetical protein